MNMRFSRAIDTKSYVQCVYEEVSLIIQYNSYESQSEHKHTLIYTFTKL